MSAKTFFKKHGLELAFVFGFAAVMGPQVYSAWKYAGPKESSVTCPSAGGKYFAQHYDGVYKDAEAEGTVLVARDDSRITVPANCFVTLKPYAQR